MDRIKNTIALFDKLADRYQQNNQNVDKYAQGLALFCDFLPPRAKLLELACGPGNVTRYLLDKRPDLDIFASDLAPNMITLAQATNPEARFEIMDSRQINQLTSRYDAVVCAFFLPYLSREEATQLLSDIGRLLPSGGLLYLSTMEGQYNQSGFESASSGDLMYMHYHESAYLAEVLQAGGFVIPYRENIGSTFENGTIDLVMVAKKI